MIQHFIWFTKHDNAFTPLLATVKAFCGWYYCVIIIMVFGNEEGRKEMKIIKMIDKPHV